MSRGPRALGGGAPALTDRAWYTGVLGWPSRNWVTPPTTPFARLALVSPRGAWTVNGEVAAVTDWEPPPVKVTVTRPSAVTRT